MKEFVPECVRQFVSVCLTNVNNIFLCVCVQLLSFIVVFILIYLLYTLSKLTRVGG